MWNNNTNMETEKRFNSEESLELIRNMIAATRSNYEKNAGASMLVWGYTSLGVGVLIFLLFFVGAKMWAHALWWLIPVIGYPVSYWVARKHPKPVRTYVDTFIFKIWRVIGIVCVAFPLVLMFSPYFSPIILPIESMLLCVSAVLTAWVLELRSMLWGTCLALLLTMLMFIFPQYMIGLFLGVILLALIIPGHILNHKGRCSKN